MIKHREIQWLGFAVITVIMFSTLGIAVLTAQRQQVDAPLVALAEGTAAQLNNGVAPQHATIGAVNMSQSLDPFTIIYTRSGQPIDGSGVLNGKLPTIPIGVLTASRGKEFSPVTWQPQESLRFASISVAANSYYVVSGQSLRVADRSSVITDQIVGLGCIVSLAVIAMLYFMQRPVKK